MYISLKSSFIDEQYPSPPVFRVRQLHRQRGPFPRRAHYLGDNLRPGLSEYLEKGLSDEVIRTIGIRPTMAMWSKNVGQSH
jgi:hypothetical protein